MQRKLLAIATACALAGGAGIAAADKHMAGERSPQQESKPSGVISSEKQSSQNQSTQNQSSQKQASQKQQGAAVEGMDQLQAAADRLRQSVQQMVDLKASDQRNTAMKQARQALFDTQEAMIAIAPKVVGSADGGAATKDGARDDAMDSLKQAAERLRKSIQALADAPSDERRNAALKQARAALIDTQTAMVNLPN